MSTNTYVYHPHLQMFLSVSPQCGFTRSYHEFHDVLYTHGLCGLGNNIFSVKRDLSVARVFIPWPAGNGLLRGEQPSTFPSSRLKTQMHNILMQFNCAARRAFTLVWFFCCRLFNCMVRDGKKLGVSCRN